jgi:hypothetical protein
VGLVILSLAGASFYFYHQYKKASLSVLSQNNQSEAEKLVSEIKNFMELPEETPTLATVTDVTQARVQPFFAKAENGDKVLIFLKAKRAILYRPSIKKIIEVANVASLDKNVGGTSPVGEQSQSANTDNSKDDSSNNSSQEKTESKVVKVAIYNGSRDQSLTETLARKISSLEKVRIIEKSNAQETYDVTFVADLTGENASLVEKIAQAVGGQVGVFPESEKMPEGGADILVIGGGR